MAPGNAADGVVAPEAVEGNDVVDDALRYFVSSMLSTLQSLCEINQLQTLKDEEFGDWHR